MTLSNTISIRYGRLSKRRRREYNANFLANLELGKAKKRTRGQNEETVVIRMVGPKVQPSRDKKKTRLNLSPVMLVDVSRNEINELEIPEIPPLPDLEIQIQQKEEEQDESKKKKRKRSEERQLGKDSRRSRPHCGWICPQCGQIRVFCNLYVACFI